jgi:hypothetical protein
MPDPIDLDLTGIARARDELRAVDARRAGVEADLVAAQRRLDDLRRRGGSAAAGATAESARDRLGARRSELRDRLGELRGRIGGLADGLVDEIAPERGALDPGIAVTALDGRVPVALLPVRIETRFGDDRKSLRIRIFPDQIHLDGHEPELTDDERAAGEWYWQQRWADLDSAEAAQVAWQKLTERYRPGRARYVVDLLHPTNADAAPDAAPAFPSTDRRAAPWTRAVAATALPDRWAAIGYQGDREVFRVWSDRVPDRLPTGPAPGQDPTPETHPGEPPLSEELRWAVDFDAAKAAGMAMVVEDAKHLAPRSTLKSGLSRLVVIGVDWTLTPDDGAAQLEALLAGHAATGDLAFVAPGAPTNNTQKESSAYTSAQPERAAEWAPPLGPAEPLEATAAERLGTALGVDPAILAIAPGAHGHHHRTASALVDALWEATGGYYASELLDPHVSDRTIAALRTHAALHLHPSGPLPAVRIGRQPYGILPVVAPAFAPNRMTAEPAVQRVASAVRALWEPLVDRVPRLGRAGEQRDPDEIMLDLLQRTPVAWSTRWREMIPPPQWSATDWAAQFRTYQAPLLYTIMANLGVDNLHAARVQYLLASDQSHRLDVPLVVKGDEGTAYLGEIAGFARGGKAGRTALNLRQNSIALLEALLAFAAVQEMDRGATSLIVAELTEAERIDVGIPKLGIRTPDLVRVEAPDPDRRPFAFQSGRELASVTMPGTTVSVHDQLAVQLAGSRLDDLIALPDAPANATARFLKAIETLAATPPDEIEWAFRGVLDLYSSRLDAWFTSLASARLARHRSAKPKGVHIGCYGWVDDLAPDVGAAAESLGYVATPSLSHAVGAAMLRSGRQAHVDEGAFDLDLSSRRVREAMALLEGVAAGQSIAALVGYRIERGLRDAGLADLTVPLRIVAPLQSRDAEHDVPMEAVAARDVVDGVRLLSLFAGPAVEWDAVVTRVGAGGRRGALEALLREVAADYDAVSDVLFAETMHQTAVGNLDRAGAAAGALDRQERPVEPEVTLTPRDGATVANRVVVVLGAATGSAGWPARGLHGTLEPRLDRWLGDVLGDPAQLTIAATLVRVRDGGEPVPTQLPAVAAKQLGLSPLALVLAAGRPAGEGRTELEQRIANAAAAGVPDLASTDRIEVEQGGLVTTLAGWAGQLAGARALVPADLVLAGSGERAGDIDAAELQERVDAALTAVRGVRTSLKGLAADASAAQLRSGLRAASEIVPEAVAAPVAGDADAREALAAQVSAALAVLDARISAIERLSGEPSTDPVARAAELARLALGGSAPLLPLFTLAESAELAASLADRDALLGADGTAPISWLHRMALVRPELDPLAGILTHAEAAGADLLDGIAIAQLPHRPGAPWAELPFGASGPPPAGTIAFAIVAPRRVGVGGPISGLFIDSWSEVIPSTEHTAGLTFHYDAPGARPPQAIVLAVHPQLDPQRWDLDTLLATVEETRSLAMLRTLSLKEIEGFAGLLPALYLPNNYTRDVPGVSPRWLVDAAAAAQLLTRTASQIVGR